MLTERDRPRGHLIADDFFPPEALRAIFAEVSALGRRMKPGLVRDVGHDGQSVFFEHTKRRRNEAVWIHDPSKTLRLFREHLWSGPMCQAFDEAKEPLFQVIPSCHAPHLQVSRYMTGDHYDFHLDEGAGVNLTAIVFLARDPAKVRGGDLELAHGGEVTKIRFRHNRLVIFPSKTLHRVTRVRVASEDKAFARVSLQCWLAHGPGPVAPKRRAAEADRPTFLLAEAPILAAAQAVGQTSGADPTAEELYWGTFYLTRILTQNLRCLAASAFAPGAAGTGREGGSLRLGPIRVRRRGELEVYARGRIGARSVRVGFLLRGPEAAPEDALDLFVEVSGERPGRASVPLGAGEREVTALLRRLLPRRP
jgi:hypothetical protein